MFLLMALIIFCVSADTLTTKENFGNDKSGVGANQPPIVSVPLNDDFPDAYLESDKGGKETRVPALRS